MSYSEDFKIIIVKIIKSILNYNTKHINFDSSKELTFFIKYSVSSYNICLFVFLSILILNMIVNFFFKNNSIIVSYVKYIDFITIVTLLPILLMKLYFTLRLESVIGIYFYNAKLEFFKANNNLKYLEHFTAFTSSFSDAILILSFLVGLICLELLGSKNLFKSINNISVFYLFNLFILIMVSTNNLLIMFISFEFIFLPTIYFAYMFGYSKKIDKAAEILIYWTLFGSFLVLCNLAYIYYKYNTLNYLYLCKKNFSKIETIFLFFNFLFGFGIKIPIAPLHYWLLKVHVEAPTAFSIYLSGFLVKSALYCLYMFINIFSNNNLYIYLIAIIMYSLLIGTLGLARQIDLKKLIAWATIQEMSFMLIFLVFKQIFLIHTCILFIILHGLMSSYMFYIVDILQRRFKTRSLKYIVGLNVLFPEIIKYIWFIILVFSGFPLTIKFFIEWSLISLLIETNKFLLIFVLFLVNFGGVIFFCRIMFTIIYGSPLIKITDMGICQIQKKEKIILNMLLYFMIMLLPIIFLI